VILAAGEDAILDGRFSIIGRPVNWFVADIKASNALAKV
jgi:hypothetical protein